MKIKTEKKDYQIIGAKSKTFSVDTDDTMVIKLLRDKMYKNKIGAVAREVSSNSRDANREAGRGDSPIVISIETESNLLSSEDTSITFQDNGIGISPDRMENIFLKYGGSTKRDSDKFTGGFGIGAKTPFAYNDNFFISTIVEDSGVRTEYLYQAIITSDGNSEVSRMIELGSSTTTEQTGTKITVPLKSDEDRVKFEKEINFVTRFWTTQPIIKNFLSRESGDEKGNVIFEDDMLIAYQEEDNKELFNSDVKIVALIDEIPYPINHKTLEKEIGVKLGLSNNDTIKWVLKFKTGDITVSGSREDIEYVERNLKTIHNTYLSFFKIGRDLITDFQSKPTTYLEACKYSEALQTYVHRYYNANRTIGDFSVGYLNFLGEVASAIGKQEKSDDRFSNNVLNSLIFFDFEGELTVSAFNFHTIVVDDFSLDNNGRMVKNKGYSMNQALSKKWDKTKFLLDTPKVEPTRNARLKLDYADNGYVLIKKLTHAQYDNQQYKSISLPEFTRLQKQDEKLYELLNVETTNYSDIEKLRKEKSASKGKRDIVKVNVRVLSKVGYEQKWVSASINYDKKGETFVNEVSDINNNTLETEVTGICYVSKDKLSDFKAERYGQSINGLPKSLDSVRKILLANGVQTIGISNSKLGYFKNVPTMQEALSIVIKKDKSNNVINCIKSTVIESSGLHQTKLLSTLKFNQKLKGSIERVGKLYDEVGELKKVNLSVKTMLNIFKNNISTHFLTTLNIELDKEFENDLKLANDCLVNNPLLKLILNIKSTSDYGGYRVDKNSKEFKDIESVLSDNLNLR
tara:strand:+ start:3348 stop:5750 length:2403 start_codon:yes stop_codon:yes gene_type:complete